MATTMDPYNHARRHFAEVVGLSRGKNIALTFIAVITTIFGLGMGALAWYSAKIEGSRIERYVIYLDDQNQPVGSPVAVATNWTPDAGVYVDFARKWVRFLRSRPADVPTLKWQREQVIFTTDRRLYTQLQPSMKAADEALRSNTMTVDQISSNLVGAIDPDTHSAIMLVRWVERVQQAGAESVTMTATIKVASIQPKVKGEFERNPLGLYVTEFQITREM